MASIQNVSTSWAYFGGGPQTTRVAGLLRSAENQLPCQGLVVQAILNGFGGAREISRGRSDAHGRFELQLQTPSPQYGEAQSLFFDVLDSSGQLCGRSAGMVPRPGVTAVQEVEVQCHRVRGVQAENQAQARNPQSVQAIAQGSGRSHSHGPVRSAVNPWPIDDARHNLTLLAQELTLLEGHLGDAGRSCPECITKHALAASGLAQEGSRLANGPQYQDLWLGARQVAGQTLRSPNLQAVRGLRQAVVRAVVGSGQRGWPARNDYQGLARRFGRQMRQMADSPAILAAAARAAEARAARGGRPFPLCDPNGGGGDACTDPNAAVYGACTLAQTSAATVIALFLTSLEFATRDLSADPSTQADAWTELFSANLAEALKNCQDLPAGEGPGTGTIGTGEPCIPGASPGCKNGLVCEVNAAGKACCGGCAGQGGGGWSGGMKGEPCTVKEDCSGSLQCVDKVCDCVDGLALNEPCDPDSEECLCNAPWKCSGRCQFPNPNTGNLESPSNATKESCDSVKGALWLGNYCE